MPISRTATVRAAQHEFTLPDRAPTTVAGWKAAADGMLSDIPAFQNGHIKLGFQAHYPELETKLAIHSDSEADLNVMLAPVEAEVRKRLGNFIIAEDNQTLEGVVLTALLERGLTLATAEMFSGGHMAAKTGRGSKSGESLVPSIEASTLERLDPHAVKHALVTVFGSKKRTPLNNS